MARHRPLGAAEFERFYGELYGERWGELRGALLEGEPPVPFLRGLLRPYLLDPASVLAAAVLEVRPGHRVLDLCAAPGGKSLVLATDLADPDRDRESDDDAGRIHGKLVCNERSSARRARLHRVLDEHLPQEIRELVTVTGHDAARWAVHESSAYDRVLADVPCSSEQHVLRAPGALADWSASRTRRLAAGAYAIGCAAVDAVRPGGQVVYATCALSQIENDGVVSRLLARGRGRLVVLDATAAMQRAVVRHHDMLRDWPASGRVPGERTEHGHLILPDRDHGLGPMYIALIRRDA